ncbi:MAG: tail fiber domain-containing protein [Steroidobacteraceae bacterium]|jgi:hypothetical protein
MKTFYKCSLFLIASLAVAGTAYGQDNTAYGEEALNTNVGFDNSAFGFETLYYNYNGSYNTASGYQALFYNVIGANNTAMGYQALYGNPSTAGGNNTATGYEALYSFITASNNTATGYDALYSNQSGDNNTASGMNALYFATGSDNIAMGYAAGTNLTTGSNNIEIGNKGAAGDNKVIRIGTEATQKKAFVAGIYSNTTVSGLAVVIGSNGELGAVSSSERFKTAIAPMGANTEKLQQLRPVTFRYKADSQGTLRYGLIAEEVAKVYPELVVRDEKGRIDGVRYDELAPMLLNELQKQQRTADTQASKVAAQDAKIRGLEQEVAELNNLKAEMHAALVKLQSKDQLVAQR